MIVTTPDWTHAEVAIDFLRAGIAVYLEKPLAITVEDADEVLRTAHETGTKLYVGHNFRHAAVVRLMHDIIARGEIGASNIVTRIFEPDFLMENELVFIGSPQTVTRKLRKAAEIGFFNTFMGEFNFSDLPENDLLRSIRLFGEQVVPALRSYEPF